MASIVEVNGNRVLYDIAGSGEPVLLIHPEIVVDAFEPLVTKGGLTDRYQLISYDRVGYGGSASEGGIGTMAGQVADAAGLLRALGFERVHVAGHSLGGSIALQLALDEPRLVHSVAVLEPLIPHALATTASSDHLVDLIDAAFSLYLDGDFATAVDAWARGAFGPRYDYFLNRALPEAIRQSRSDAAAVFQTDAIIAQTWGFASEHAARLLMPLLSLFHPDRDWDGFQEIHEWLLRSAPGAEGAELKCSSHLLQIVDPAVVGDALAAFWAAHPLT